jgi:hypothetical protein
VQSVQQTGDVASAPPAAPAVLPGAVGDIPYVYNDKQYLPSRAATTGFPIVWLFADNKTPDPLYFGFQSADGTMHVYNEIKPHSVTRQQAFGNEFWTVLASDKRTGTCVWQADAAVHGRAFVSVRGGARQLAARVPSHEGALTCCVVQSQCSPSRSHRTTSGFRFSPAAIKWISIPALRQPPWSFPSHKLNI